VRNNSKIAPGEYPPDRFGGPLVSYLERHQAALQSGQAIEGGWREELALDNLEVDLDLVEPACMNRRMQQNNVGPSGAKAIGGTLAAMRRAVVDDQEHPTCRAVRFLAMAWATRRSNAAVPFFRSQRPNSLARCTSQAAR
jgi:hypothetical protein